MTKEELKHVGLIGMGVPLLIFLGFYFAPASQLGPVLFPEKIAFMLFTFGAIPALIFVITILGYAFYPALLLCIANKLTAKGVMIAIIYYSLWTVLWTGGIHSSPFNPLVPIIPLLASPILSKTNRSSLLFWFAIGLVVVACLSCCNHFHPVTVYPKNGGWEMSEKGSIPIVTLIVLAGVAMERFLIRKTV